MKSPTKWQRLWQINNYHKQQARPGASSLPVFAFGRIHRFMQLMSFGIYQMNLLPV